MRILIVHNHYGDFATDGEGQVVRAECDLLRSQGHVVSLFAASNGEFDRLPLIEKCRSLWQVGWSESGHARIRAAIDLFRPDLMHVHNYWFRLSPSVFAAAKEQGVATVLTLHNYRLLCPAAVCLRNGKPCELCVDGNASRILIHRCYPGGSWIKSALAYRLYRETRRRQTLTDLVDAYIALTEFGRHKAIAAGVPRDRLYVKPNFMMDPLRETETPTTPAKGAIYVGRVAPEKGVLGLVAAWRHVDYPLSIVGDGPQMREARNAAGRQVTFLGRRPHDDAVRLIREAAFLVFPSEWYEGFPLTLLESMAVGRTALASDLGSRREMVSDGQTGLLYRSGDIQDLASKAARLISNERLCSAMGSAARETYLAKYTPATNYDLLMRIYERALLHGRRRPHMPTPQPINGEVLIRVAAIRRN